MRKRSIKSLTIAVIGCFYAFVARSAVSLFSDYGQIQNVQNYSTNPFWSPNAPYNQRVAPQPVYVQGNNVTGEECTRVIQSAVAFQCSARDNCRNTTLADIRPAIRTDLSREKSEQDTSKYNIGDSVEASVVSVDGNNVKLSIRALQVTLEKQAVKEFANEADSGSVLGDILGAAIENSKK